MGLSPLWGQVGGRLKLQLGINHLDIVPESLQDEVYIAAVFGVKKTGDVVAAIFMEAAPVGVTLHSPKLRLMRAEGVN